MELEACGRLHRRIEVEAQAEADVQMDEQRRPRSGEGNVSCEGEAAEGAYQPRSDQLVPIVLISKYRAGGREIADEVVTLLSDGQIKAGRKARGSSPRGRDDATRSERNDCTETGLVSRDAGFKVQSSPRESRAARCRANGHRSNARAADGAVS